MTSTKNQMIFVSFLLFAIAIVIDANFIVRNQYGYGNRVPSRNNVTHYGGYRTNRTNSFGNWPPSPSARFNNNNAFTGVRNSNVRTSYGNWPPSPYGRFNNTAFTGVRNSNVPRWNQTISHPRYQSGSQGGYAQIYNGGFNQRNSTFGSPYRRPFNYTNAYRRFY